MCSCRFAVVRTQMVYWANIRGPMIQEETGKCLLWYYAYVRIYIYICIYMALQNYLDSITTQCSLICTYRIYSTKFLRCKILEDFL